MPISLPRIHREDVALFINAACACTGQSEFYGAASVQRVSLSFLHEYVRGNYRRLYALCLAAGINDFNRAQILAALLASGAPDDATERVEEGALIAAALQDLPPQRVYRLFDRLRRARVNNRRTRAAMRRWLARRPDLAFDALKYRGHLRSSARHAHLDLRDDELHGFLFEGPHSRTRWAGPLLDAFRRAKYEERAIYELPFTIAEGLAASRGVRRERFLQRIEPRLTAGERARIEQRARRDGASLEALDLGRMSLDRLCVYLLSRPIAERRERAAEIDAALDRAARRALRGAPPLPRRVHAVLDRSHSSRGGAQKRNRPLAVAWGASVLLRAAVPEYRAVWTTPTPDERALAPTGQTALATALVEALRGAPDLVIVVSDGFENDPPGSAAEVARIFRQRIDPRGRTAIVHLNPVFDADRLMPRPLGPDVPTVGLRDAAELPVKIGFARFVQGDAPLAELEAWLRGRAARLREKHGVEAVS